MVTLILRHASRARRFHGNLQLSGSGELGDRVSDIVPKNPKPTSGKLRVRADTFGYIQRAFPDCISEVDASEARIVGQKGVRADDHAWRRRRRENVPLSTSIVPTHAAAD